MVSPVSDLLNLEYLLVTQVEILSSQLDLRICSCGMRFGPGIWESSQIQRSEREVARKSLKSQIFSLVIEGMVMSFTVIWNSGEGTVFKKGDGVGLRDTGFEVSLRHPEGSAK